MSGSDGGALVEPRYVPTSTYRLQVHGGFPLTAAGSFFLVTTAFGARRYLLSFAIGLALGFICWYGFGALGVRLGPISPLLGG